MTCVAFSASSGQHSHVGQMMQHTMHAAAEGRDLFRYYCKGCAGSVICIHNRQPRDRI